jgi:hypothetical protein
MSKKEKQEHRPEASAPSLTEIARRLSAPFQPEEVRFKPAVVSGNRALALAYVDARAIQDRLDEVLGVMGWQDSYKCLEDGSVVCRLRLRLGDEWITKMDVGSPSEQPDGGDRLKAAFSDALKRAAVKFGIGRYLYRLPTQWVDYDPHKRQFARPPQLPAFALPPRKQAAAAAAEGPAQPPSEPMLPAPTAAGPARPRSAGRAVVRPAAHALPANGEELQRRLYDYDAKLAAEGTCAAGELVKHVVAAGQNAGYDADLATWSGPAIHLAAEETRRFESQARDRQPRRKEVA